MSTASESSLIEAVAATPRLLVALDFDGVLSPLVDEPMTARMLPESRAAVLRLAELPETEIAFVSGRTLADLRVISEHDPASPFHLAGSHGAQFWHPGDAGDSAHDDRDSAEALRDELREAAENTVNDVEEVWIEPKEFGFGVHTRLADEDDTRTAVDRIDALMRERAPGWRRRAGHDILEFSSRHEGKDSAVAALRARLGATAVLFVGDDITDEDAIASLGPGDLGVRVGEGESVARVRVADPRGAADLLVRVAELRRAAQRAAAL